MHTHLNINLLALSFAITCVTTLVVFHLVDRLYKSFGGMRTLLVTAFSVIAGACVWGNHMVISYALQPNLIFTPRIFINNAFSCFMALIFAIFMAYCIFDVASQRNLKFYRMFNNGIIAGFSALGLFYFNLTSLHSAATLQFNPITLIAATVVCVCLAILVSMIFFWQKTYIGNYKFWVKLSLTCMVALAIIAGHISLNGGLVISETAPTSLSLSQQDNLIGYIVALSVISLILVAFIFSLFFERYGKQLLRFKFIKPIQEEAFENSSGAKDSLTNLPNGREFRQLLKTAAERCELAGNSIALAYIDLDHFKPINDKYGHHIGDAVLTTVAQRLQAAVRSCDAVARLGGDEFAAVIEDIGTDKDIIPIVERIVKSINLPIYINRQLIEISCSVGIALYPRDGDIEKLMICADSAMYKAKQNGKNQFKFYDAELESASNDMQIMQADLLTAIEKNQFTLLYQPKLDCKTQLFVGAEALIRWNHPTKGIIMPADLIPAAEHLGLIDQINDWVTQEACRAIGRAKANGIDLNLSINLSKHLFRNKNLVTETIQYLKQFNAPAENLTFEIKETSGVRDEALFNQLIAQLKAANIRIALDDFGLHPFTLNYLQDLNVDEIKIDKIFIDKLNAQAESWKLTGVLINLAHTLKINVVAEGIENHTQRSVLTQLGCDHMQGYLFSTPINENDLYLFCNQHHLSFEQSSFQPSAQENLTSA